jgi:hypothetical protein
VDRGGREQPATSRCLWEGCEDCLSHLRILSEMVEGLKQLSFRLFALCNAIATQEVEVRFQSSEV